MSRTVVLMVVLPSVIGVSLIAGLIIETGEFDYPVNQCTQMGCSNTFKIYISDNLSSSIDGLVYVEAENKTVYDSCKQGELAELTGGQKSMEFQTRYGYLNISEQNDTLDNVKIGEITNCDAEPEIVHSIESVRINDEVSWPNGKDCGPRCWQGSVSISSSNIDR